MQKVDTTQSGLDEFAVAREQFDRLVNQLGSTATMQSPHGEVEKLIWSDGMEVLRRLFQGHLTRRANEEPLLSEVIGADNRVRNHRRKVCERPLESLFGEVTVQRIGYSQRGADSLFPLDAQLNLPDGEYSDGLRRRIGVEAALNSYDVVVARIEETTGGAVPKAQAEQLVVKLAQDFNEFYEKVEHQSDPGALKEVPLIVSLDGKGIVMRPEGLRQSTRKAAERENHKLKTRLSKGEKRNRKRTAQVATVYDIERHVRSAENVMGNKEDRKDVKPRPKDKRVWAGVKEEANEIVGQAIEEALRRDPEKKRPWAILVDGHKQQLMNIKSSLALHGIAKVRLVLDFVHVLEYLWKAVLCFEEEASNAAERWVQKRMLKILKGKSSDVAAGIRRSATLRNLSSKQRQAADTCADYLLNHHDMLRYEECLEQGLPIATGVIEGACRHLIKDRMDVTGARWGLEGADAILKLRSLFASGDFDKYFEFHKEKEHQRLHSRRFQCSTASFSVQLPGAA